MACRQYRKDSYNPVALDLSGHWREAVQSAEVNGLPNPKPVILYAEIFCLRYAVSCRDLAETVAERWDTVDYATLNRWVVL